MSKDFLNLTARKLTDVIDQELPLLKAIPDEKASHRVNQNSWTVKQILGHLIDSACNNHRRFITGINKDDLIFDGYNQEVWVGLQNFNSLDWEFLVRLWYDYNSLLAHVISNLPEERVLEERKKHSYDRVAFKIIPADQLATLAYLIEDYIDHLEHHLDQIQTLVRKDR